MWSSHEFTSPSACSSCWSWRRPAGRPPSLPPPRLEGKLKIALSNSFIGNQWRVEMENVFKAACAMPPYAAAVECSVFNAGNDVSTQSRQISNLISQGVDGIVINAASTSGLNGVVQQACDRGIVVVSFDNTVDHPCGITVNTDQVKFGQQLAQFVVDQLGGKGNVVMVTGVAGTGADNDRNKGAKEVFAANPGIKVVAEYSGMWDSATAQRVTAAQLPSLPEVDEGVGVGRHRRGHQGLRRRQTGHAGVRRRGRERLPQVHGRDPHPEGDRDVDRPAALPVGGGAGAGAGGHQEGAREGEPDDPVPRW